MLKEGHNFSFLSHGSLFLSTGKSRWDRKPQNSVMCWASVRYDHSFLLIRKEVRLAHHTFSVNREE